MPASLAGAERIITANDTKGGGFGSYQITVDVLAPANLFLYIDDRIDVAASMGWVASQGWTETSDDLTTLEGSTTRTYSIFTQMVGAQTIMTFEQSGASMYGMAGIPKPITQDETTTSIPEPGSLLLLVMGLGGIAFGVWYRHHARRDAIKPRANDRKRRKR